MEWRLLRLDDLDDDPWLVETLEAFQPLDPEREADRAMADWLTTEAVMSDREVWLLLNAQQLAAFHSAEEKGAELEGKGWRKSLHVALAGRDRAYAAGGAEIVNHARELAETRGLELVTLDPLDPDVAAVWRRHGFDESLTRVQDDPTADHFRLFLPV